MKKRSLAVLMAVTMFLGGCSLLEDVNNTLTYADEATEYANEVDTFLNEVPSLTEQAVSDEQAAAELETRLEEMKQNAEGFNELEPPAMGSDLHQRVVEQNNRAIEGINVYLENIENGTLDPSVLENNQAFQSLRQTMDIIDQIQQLGE